GSYTVLDHHIKRLQESAAYFDFSLDLKNIEQQLQQLKVTHDTGSWRVRLTVSQNGSNDITTTSIQKSSENKLVRFADAPINKNIPNNISTAATKRCFRCIVLELGWSGNLIYNRKYRRRNRWYIIYTPGLLRVTTRDFSETPFGRECYTRKRIV